MTHAPPSSHHTWFLFLTASLLLAAGAAAELSFVEQSLELPGAPAALVAADVDGDGLRDLAVVVVFTAWDQIGVEEYTEMDEVEGLVEMLTIVPTLMDRRELRLYRGRPEGGFALAGPPLPLPLGVLSLEAGPPGLPVVALTDAGVSALRVDAAGALSFAPVVAEPPVLAGTGTFLAGLDLVQDVTGDGVADLLLPAAGGVAVFRGRAAGDGGGLEPRPLARVPYPRVPGPAGPAVDVPLPAVLDVDGDGLPDLVFRAARRGSGARQVARQTAPGRFAPPAAVERPPGGGADGASGDGEDGGGDFVWLGPVDAAPGAELVLADGLDGDDDGVREAMRQVREPRYRVRLHPLGGGAVPAAAPSRAFEVTGWVAEAGGDGSLVLPGGFRDLDGDGRADLVTVTNDITLFKAMRVLATRRLTLDLGFLAWCQRPDGSFVLAPGEPMRSKLTIDLDDLELRQRSLFSGDFDGDGRRDFLQLDHEREIGVHLGRAGCSYPPRPDRALRLRAPLRDLALAEVADLDGDGRDDLAVTHPRQADEPGESPPVRLDLYLSREGDGAKRRGRR